MRAGVLVVVIALVASASRAHADRKRAPRRSPPQAERAAPPAPEAEKPWAAGVPEARQATALALYKQGNELFAQDQFLEALEVYLRALEAWDHPMIRYNAAVCLIHLDRVVDADAHLEQALRFGAAPLGPELHKEGLRHQKQLARQLGSVEVTCREPGAAVTLDGKPLFVGPGSATRRLLTGSHQIVVTKQPTHLTETRTVLLMPGQREAIAIVMKRPSTSTRRSVRRWAAWKPWTVLGGGAVVAVGGVGMYLVARGDYRDFDQFVLDNPGTQPPADVTRRRDRASALSIPAYSALAIGGAVLATGVVLVIENRPRLVGAVVAPQVGRDRVGVAISGQF